MSCCVTGHVLPISGLQNNQSATLEDTVLAALHDWKHNSETLCHERHWQELPFSISIIVVREIANLSTHGYFMVSVRCGKLRLFTKIPLEESIDLAVKYIPEGNPNLKLNQSYLNKLFMSTTVCRCLPFSSVLPYDSPASLESWLGGRQTSWLLTSVAEGFHNSGLP